MAKRPAGETDVPAHIRPRHARIRAALVAKRLDAILLTIPPDVGYVTGHAWEDSFGVLTADRLTLISDFRYQTQLRDHTPWARLLIRKTKQSMADAVADVLMREKLGRVAFESNFTTFATVQNVQKKLREKSRRGRPAKLVPLADFMVNHRKIKDSTEIAAIKRAVAVAQDAYNAVRRDLRVGMTENEIAGRMDFEMRRLGASSGSFETNVSAGPNSALPHYRPADVKISPGQPLLFDWGAKVGFYCSDITRTHFMGRVNGKMREIYDVVLDAQQSAIAAIKPGVKTRQADKVARDIIKTAGYGKDFGHGLGHGIGLAVHELPRLSPAAADEPLRPGMIVTVEPGIYLAGVGGVRIEDDVLVTESGCEVLTSLDKSYEGACLE